MKPFKNVFIFSGNRRPIFATCPSTFFFYIRGKSWQFQRPLKNQIITFFFFNHKNSILSNSFHQISSFILNVKKNNNSNTNNFILTKKKQDRELRYIFLIFSTKETINLYLLNVFEKNNVLVTVQRFVKPKEILHYKVVSWFER